MKPTHDTRKKLLILAMGSQNHRNALKAIGELTRTNWLYDGSLHRADLSKADLHAADLCEANLYGADLSNCDLKDAQLREANLHNADLKQANLKNANLKKAILRRANLYKANLVGADLSYAILHGADLRLANLHAVNDIETAIMDEHTILPNGDHWHDGYDLRRFTDENHPDYWDHAAQSLADTNIPL